MGETLLGLARFQGCPFSFFLASDFRAWTLARIARVDVLVIDDFAISPVKDEERRDLFEILEDRHGTRSTIVSSQLPPSEWHDYLADPTLADAICDRIVHHAHRLVLKGPSRRKEKPTAEK